VQCCWPDYDLAQLVPCIDWAPFFQTWDLAGSYPAILDDPRVGETARTGVRRRAGHAEAHRREKWLSANGVFGLFPANSRRRRRRDLHRRIAPDSAPDLAQPAPAAGCVRRASRTTACRTSSPRRTRASRTTSAPSPSPPASASRRKLAEFAAQHDDYNAILLKALADRLAEAFAEHLHRRVRREYWGYAADEKLTNEELIAEKYRGIRPAAGYPACPDHTEKGPLFALLDAEKHTGMALTESFAMHPAASVSGFYLAHPEARYFAVTKIARDQLEDWAQRAGFSVGEAQRWLAPLL
jgi:5-methyltetrahydrofolate--homocysteine methyltransferase